MVSDLHAFCEEQKLTRSHFIGHSMGGKTAMQFALSFPQLVDRLVIVDINPFKAKGHHYHILEALGQINPAQLSSLKEAEAILTKSLRDKALCMFLLKNLKRSRQAGYEWKMNLKAITRHYNKIMTGIRGKSFYGPVLFIRGENSPYIRENDIKGIIDLFPSARIETVENAGHWLHWEKPDAFIRLASTFFKSSKN